MARLSQLFSSLPAWMAIGMLALVTAPQSRAAAAEGEISSARDCFRAVTEMESRIGGDPSEEAATLLHYAENFCIQGRFDDAEKSLDDLTAMTEGS